MKNKIFKTLISKILCTTLILSFLTPPSFAYQNYIHTTTTSENYSASSPVGRFENHTTNGALAPVYNYNNYVGYPIVAGPQVYGIGPEYTNNQPYYSPNYTEYDTANKNTESNLNNTYQNPQIAGANPMINYGYNAPMYTAGATYMNPNYNQTASVQDIEVPQNYNKTITTTQEYVDTRENADKIIDRGD